MSSEERNRVLATKTRGPSSVTLVLVGLVAALVAVLAWPALDRILWNESARSTLRGE